MLASTRSKLVTAAATALGLSPMYAVLAQTVGTFTPPTGADAVAISNTMLTTAGPFIVSAAVVITGLYLLGRYIKSIRRGAAKPVH